MRDMSGSVFQSHPGELKSMPDSCNTDNSTKFSRRAWEQFFSSHDILESFLFILHYDYTMEGVVDAQPLRVRIAKEK